MVAIADGVTYAVAQIGSGVASATAVTSQQRRRLAYDSGEMPKLALPAAT